LPHSEESSFVHDGNPYRSQEQRHLGHCDLGWPFCDC
jgi:hypothetical protein